MKETKLSLKSYIPHVEKGETRKVLNKSFTKNAFKTFEILNVILWQI